MGVGLGKIAVSVTVEMAGDPLLTTGARMAVSCEMLDGSDFKDSIGEPGRSVWSPTRSKEAFPWRSNRPL